MGSSALRGASLAAILAGCTSAAVEAPTPASELAVIELHGLPPSAEVMSVEIAGRMGCPAQVVLARGAHASRGRVGEAGSVSCPMGSVCQLLIRSGESRHTALVPATQRHMTFATSIPDGAGTALHLTTKDPVASGLLQLLDLELQLSIACASHEHAEVSAAEEALSDLASHGSPAMRGAAALAFYQCRCSGHDLPRETATSLLREIEPTSIATRLWPQGYGTMLAHVVPPGDLGDRVMQLANEGRAELGAHALVAAAKHEASSESAGVLEARERLSQPPWKDTYVAKFQPQVMIQRDLEVDLQTWTVELSDGTVASIPIGSGPTLVYLTAAYCGACRAAAPRLRKLAAAHPSVEIVYLVWDGAVDELTADHLPIPGTLAVPTEEFRASWRAAFGEPSLPGFVAIIDRTHAVAHSSNASLSQAFEILTEHRIDTPPAAPDTAVR